MRIGVSLLMAALPLLLVGCALVAPVQLENARATYARAAGGPAKQLAPSELDEAARALAEAEQSFKNEETAKVVDLAYVAERMAQLAEARAGLALAEQRKRSALATHSALERRAERAPRCESKATGDTPLR